MKFSIATVLAFAAAVMAQPAFTNVEFNVVEGKPFKLTWTNAEGKIKLELMSGPDKDSLKPVQTIANLPAGAESFDFTPSNLPSGNYAFRITDESSGPEPFNYTKLIPYTGTGTVSSSTGASTTGSTTRTSTAASASSTETETETTTDTATKTTTGTQSISATSATGSVTTTLSTTRTGTSTSASRSATGTPPPNTNNGQRFASSLALVLGTVAALVFFN